MIWCKWVGLHDWFVEFDKDGKPLFRICQRCNKYEDAVLIEKTYEFWWVPPGTITQKVEQIKSNRRWNMK